MKKNFLRSEKITKEYDNVKKRRKKEGIIGGSFLKKLEKISIKNFKYWVIVPNRFPYDLIAKEHHIIFLKRDIIFDWDLLKKEEVEEFNFLRKTYFYKKYDALWENFPRTQSIPSRFHLHLIKIRLEGVWKK